MIEYSKIKLVRTYADVVCAKSVTDQLSNGEAGSQFKEIMREITIFK